MYLLSHELGVFSTEQDDLSSINGIEHLGFSPKKLLVAISPAYEWEEFLPFLEEYFMHRLVTTDTPHVMKGCLKRCKARLIMPHRIAVERCPNRDYLNYSFRSQIFNEVFGVMNDGGGLQVEKDALEPCALYDALRTVTKMVGVEGVTVTPYHVSICLTGGISRDAMIQKILAPIKEAVYGEMECEVKIFDPPLEQDPAMEWPFYDLREQEA